MWIRELASASHLLCRPVCSAWTLCRTVSKSRLQTSVRNMPTSKRGVVLGFYQEKEKESEAVLTPAAKKFAASGGSKFADSLELLKGSWKKGEARIFYEPDNDNYPLTSVVNLGPRQPENPLEELDQRAENVRTAVSAAVRALRAVGATSIDIDPCGNPEAAAEGSSLALFSFDELKKKDSRKPSVSLSLFGTEDQPLWQRGVVKSQAQNLARRLTEAPANLMTPTVFASRAAEALESLGVKVTIRDKKWIEDQKMGAFLSVAKGSEQPPIFLELQYDGSTEGDPTVFVGKGITFDSGGISLKPSLKMDRMRGDMGGGACVVGSFLAIATLKIPIRLVGLVPLAENMPSGKATKPGDVVTAMNGTTIQVDNTDAEGRLVLADALCYADTFKPRAVVDLATLTGAMAVSLGSAAAGVFCSSDPLWKLLHQAGTVTGDRVWRFPLFEHYKKQMSSAPLADLNNVGKHGSYGGACNAAAFLKEFVQAKHWAHIDIAGVMDNQDEIPYLSAGMTGRPVRTLVEFAQLLSKTQDL